MVFTSYLWVISFHFCWTLTTASDNFNEIQIQQLEGNVLRISCNITNGPSDCLPLAMSIFADTPNNTLVNVSNNKCPKVQGSAKDRHIYLPECVPQEGDLFLDIFLTNNPVGNERFGCNYTCVVGRHISTSLSLATVYSVDNTGHASSNERESATAPEMPIEMCLPVNEGLTHKYVSADFSVVELECKARVYFPHHEVLMISIYNISTMTKIAQVVGGKCPTIEDTANADHLYLPGCADLPEAGRSSLKVLLTRYDSSTAQTFLCNATKMNEEEVTSSVWVLTVDKPDSTKTTDTDYTGHTWLPDPAYKMLASLEREVSILEPALIGTTVILAIILFSLAAQLFLSCKIIRYIESRRPTKRYPLNCSQTKMSETHRSEPLEEQPFYANV